MAVRLFTHALVDFMANARAPFCLCDDSALHFEEGRRVLRVAELLGEVLVGEKGQISVVFFVDSECFWLTGISLRGNSGPIRLCSQTVELVSSCVDIEHVAVFETDTPGRAVRQMPTD